MMWLRSSGRFTKAVVVSLCCGFILVVLTRYDLTINKVPIYQYNSTGGRVFQGRLHNKVNQTLVLLVTYLRSGSTLTADIITQVPNISYVYEPLKFLVNPERSFIKKTGICSYNGACRYTRKEELNWPDYISVLGDWFNCKLENVPKDYFWNTVNSIMPYNISNCLASQHQHRNSCFIEANKVCRTSVRLVKTIRLTMDIVQDMMVRVPALKVVHLVRDPRGITSSRTFFYPKLTSDPNITNRFSESMCRRIENDINIVFTLKSKYPERVRTFLYENIATKPFEESAKLFDFLGVKPHKEFKTWLVNHTSAGNDSGYFETKRKNSTLTANIWRKTLPFSTVSVVDKNCQNVYKSLGLLPAPNEETLRNIDIPLNDYR